MSYGYGRKYGICLYGDKSYDKVKDYWNPEILAPPTVPEIWEPVPPLVEGWTQVSSLPSPVWKPIC